MWIIPFCPYVNEDVEYLLDQSPVGKSLIGVLGVELLGYIIETSNTKKMSKNFIFIDFIIQLLKS